LYRLRIKS